MFDNELSMDVYKQTAKQKRFELWEIYDYVVAFLMILAAVDIWTGGFRYISFLKQYVPWLIDMIKSLITNAHTYDAGKVLTFYAWRVLIYQWTIGVFLAVVSLIDLIHGRMIKGVIMFSSVVWFFVLGLIASKHPFIVKPFVDLDILSSLDEVVSYIVILCLPTYFDMLASLVALFGFMEVFAKDSDDDDIPLTPMIIVIVMLVVAVIGYPIYLIWGEGRDIIPSILSGLYIFLSTAYMFPFFTVWYNNAVKTSGFVKLLMATSFIAFGVAGIVVVMFLYFVGIMAVHVFAKEGATHTETEYAGWHYEGNTKVHVYNMFDVFDSGEYAILFIAGIFILILYLLYMVFLLVLSMPFMPGVAFMWIGKMFTTWTGISVPIP